MKSKQLTKDEILNYIRIGFCQPKFYKPSVWRKAKFIMDKLVELKVGVEPFDFGWGKGKYISDDNVTFEQLADIYFNHLALMEGLRDISNKLDKVIAPFKK